MKHLANIAAAQLFSTGSYWTKAGRRFEINRLIFPLSDNTTLPGPLTYSNSGTSGHHLFSGCAETHG